MSDVILETNSLTKEFKGFTAVSDVNLAVRRGSIHALIGPNGAGKTTCFNLLTKFLEPTSGVIRFKATLNKPSKFPARTRKTPFFGFCGLLRRPFGPFAGP